MDNCSVIDINTEPLSEVEEKLTDLSQRVLGGKPEENNLSDELSLK